MHTTPQSIHDIHPHHDLMTIAHDVTTNAQAITFSFLLNNSLIISLVTITLLTIALVVHLNTLNIKDAQH